MKIAVAAAGSDLEASLDARFGRCQCFVIVDTEDGRFEPLLNTAAAQGSGAGLAAAQLVANAGADAVVATHVGPNAFEALAAGGLRVYTAEGGSVREAVKAVVEGRLPETSAATVPSHFGSLSQASPAPPAEADSQLQDLRRQLAELTEDGGNCG